MFRLRRLFTSMLAAIALLALFATFTSPTYAAEKTRTFTEEQVNKAFATGAPRSPKVSDRKVDLQPGQVVVSETWTAEKKKGKETKKETVAVSVTLQPTVSNNRVEWKLVSATVNGQPASAELQKQVQNRITNSWARLAKSQAKPGRVVAVAITDSEISYTVKTEK